MHDTRKVRPGHRRRPTRQSCGSGTGRDRFVRRRHREDGRARADQTRLDARCGRDQLEGRAREVDLPVALGEQWRIRVGDQGIEGGVRNRAVGISERVRVEAGERPQSDDLAGLRIERDDRALAVTECLRRDPLDIVADRQCERGGGVSIDEEIAERGKALVDRIAGEFVVVAAFEPNGLDVERLIARDVRRAHPRGTPGGSRPTRRTRPIGRQAHHQR